MQTKIQEKPYLIEYYEAIEFLLDRTRKSTGMHRTHFGMIESPLENYCWFDTIINPYKNRRNHDAVLDGMNLLHHNLFPFYYKNQRILDVGCGCGGTMKILAKENPSSLVCGININEKQLGIAKEHFDDLGNVYVKNKNIYDLNSNEKFDIIYFIESAFHMEDKVKLAKVISNNLKTGGEVYIVDVFYSERFWQRISEKKLNQEFFHYLPVNEWQRLFKKFDLEIYRYKDISPMVANFLQIETSDIEFKEKIARPIFSELPNSSVMLDRIMDAFTGYKKLQKSLSKGLLQYGIIRAQKV